MHTPVLLQEAIRALEVSEGKKYIDATYGEGGHSGQIIKRGGKVLAIEWDDLRLKDKVYKGKSGEDLKIVVGNFVEIERIAKENDFFPVDGVLFDLGLSMEQINRSGRGFSYKKMDEPLDMRINRELERTAADIINHSSAQELYEIFSRNAEEINSRAIAHAVYKSRSLKKITTVGDLCAVIGNHKGMVRRIFQALRIEVNNEFENLKKALSGAARIIFQEGKIVVVTFHQGEDRIVAAFVRNSRMRFLTKKPISASKEGAMFERSAKLRVIGY